MNQTFKLRVEKINIEKKKQMVASTQEIWRNCPWIQANLAN